MLFSHHISQYELNQLEPESLNYFIITYVCCVCVSQTLVETNEQISLQPRLTSWDQAALLPQKTRLGSNTKSSACPCLPSIGIKDMGAPLPSFPITVLPVSVYTSQPVPKTWQSSGLAPLASSPFTHHDTCQCKCCAISALGEVLQKGPALAASSYTLSQTPFPGSMK